MDPIKAAITTALRQSFPNTKPTFLLVLLPNQSALLYDSIKSLFDVTFGIPSICCIGSKFTRKQEQYFANVAMKFNQKLGGVNHMVDIKRMLPLDAQTIIFGIDVTHPSTGSAEGAPSIAGVVASTDAMFSQYPASIRCQEGRKEMVAELEEMIVERLQLWQKRNQRTLPKKVIVYRDGVGESQYRTVVEVEYVSFKRAFNRLYGAEAKHPKTSIIMVGKRHHTRFYPTTLTDTDGSTGTWCFCTSAFEAWTDLCMDI
jgi:eukaryotic translation initiation factor 2C